MIPLSLAFTLAMLSLNVALYLTLKTFTAPFYKGTQKVKNRVLYAGFLLSLLGIVTGCIGSLAYPDAQISSIEFVVIIAMLLMTVLLGVLAVQNFKTLDRRWQAAPADKADLKHPMAVYFAPSFLELVANKTRSTVSKNLKAWGQETVAAVEAAGGYDQGGKTCCAYFVPDYSDEGFRLELLDVEKPFFVNMSTPAFFVGIVRFSLYAPDALDVLFQRLMFLGQRYMAYDFPLYYNEWESMNMDRTELIQSIFCKDDASDADEEEQDLEQFHAKNGGVA